MTTSTVSALPVARRLRAPIVLLLAALCMLDASRYGWGAATIEGDRVKWGLRSMGRSPLQPIIVVKEFCWWADGPQGLCSLEPHSDWAATIFRVAQPVALVCVAALVAAAAVLFWRTGPGLATTIGAALLTAALGVAAVAASQRIAIYVEHGTNPGWSGSLTWRFALVAIGAALLLAPKRRLASP